MPSETFVRREAELLETMGSIAGKHRHLPDAKVLKLISWIREECLTNGKWGNRRVLVFTEYVDTMSYLRDRLREAFGTTAYGFFPLKTMDTELATKLIHSANERIPVDDLELGVNMLRFTAQSLLGA